MTHSALLAFDVCVMLSALLHCMVMRDCAHAVLRQTAYSQRLKTIAQSMLSYRLSHGLEFRNYPSLHCKVQVSETFIVLFFKLLHKVND